jgi:Protein of unknown function (DUF1565)
MKIRFYLAAAFVLWMSLLTVGFAAAAAVIHVPADQPTIQGAINSAKNEDTVLVSPGTYKENINFLGKAITVKSSKGPTVTVIDGGGISSVVTFSSNETLTSVLRGFTLQNGNAMNAPNASTLEGGAIAIEKASPTIKNNVIQGNLAVFAGGGIGVAFGSPLIEGNIIRKNSQTPQFDSGVGVEGLAYVERVPHGSSAM